MAEPLSPTANPDHRLTSEKLDAFKEALEVLYLIANRSGRVHFAKNWPVAAGYLMGDVLLEYDREGAPSREECAELESAAEDRRIALLDILDTLEDKSVEEGALQTEYVQTLIEKFGRDMALLIYAPKIVDRFAPPPPGESAQALQDPPPPPAPEPPIEEPPVEDLPVEPPPLADPLEDVKPIDTPPPKPDTDSDTQN